MRLQGSVEPRSVSPCPECRIGVAGAKDLGMLAPVNTPSASGGLPQAQSATLQHYCCAGLDRCSPPRCGQRLRQTEFHIPEHYRAVFASGLPLLVRFQLNTPPMTVAKKITAAANSNPATIFPLKAAARRAVGRRG